MCVIGSVVSACRFPHRDGRSVCSSVRGAAGPMTPALLALLAAGRAVEIRVNARGALRVLAPSSDSRGEQRIVRKVQCDEGSSVLLLFAELS